jgi:hypothetical protein
MIRNYNKFILLEKFDSHIITYLKSKGIENNDEINKYLYHAHRGNLAKHLEKIGRKFTFGMLNSLFLDAVEAKRKTELRSGVIKAAHRLIPMALAPFFPILAIVGYILGTSRAFNKVIAPILADPGKDYPEFLNKLIVSTMKIAEGEMIPLKDRFSRAFVVSDGIVDLVKPEIIQEFCIYLSDKMIRKDDEQEVPVNYIENELKEYLNRRFEIDPKIPIKNEKNN